MVTKLCQLLPFVGVTGISGQLRDMMGGADVAVRAGVQLSRGALPLRDWTQLNPWVQRCGPGWLESAGRFSAGNSQRFLHPEWRADSAFSPAAGRGPRPYAMGERDLIRSYFSPEA